jgi:hypothetical protein
MMARERAVPGWSGNAARDARWLYEHRRGRTAASIGRREGVSPKLVNLGILRAEARDLDRTTEAAAPLPPPVKPLFPIPAFTPMSECPHRGPIRRGSVLCCMVCSQTGMEGHPALHKDPARMPRRERPPQRRAPKKTRKERRRVAAAKISSPVAVAV